MARPMPGDCDGHLNRTDSGCDGQAERTGGPGEIVTTLPYETVKDAVILFGGSGQWRPKDSNFSDENQDYDNVSVEQQTTQFEDYLMGKEPKAFEDDNEVQAVKEGVDKLEFKQQKDTISISTIHNSGPLSSSMELKQQGKARLSRTSSDVAGFRASSALLRTLEKEKNSMQYQLEQLSQKRVEISTTSMKNPEISKTTMGKKASDDVKRTKKEEKAVKQDKLDKKEKHVGGETLKKWKSKLIGRRSSSIDNSAVSKNPHPSHDQKDDNLTDLNQKKNDPASKHTLSFGEKLLKNFSFIRKSFQKDSKETKLQRQRSI